MERRNFYEIINNSEINLDAEYERIHDLFYYPDIYDNSLEDIISEAFLQFPVSFRKRTVSLSDFNNTYGFQFAKRVRVGSIERLILFCEYISSFINQLVNYCIEALDEDEVSYINFMDEVIDGCMDALGLVSAKMDDTIIYIEKDAGAMSVAEIVPHQIAYSVLEYNHFRLKGDLKRKSEILKAMADNIESERGELKKINAKLETQLFQLLNKFVRHDHSKTEYITKMSDVEIENVYDDIYQLWLMAKLEMDNQDRRNRMKLLLDEMNG